MTESKTASVAFASGMSSVSEVDIRDGARRVISAVPKADGGALDVRRFAGGHVREAFVAVTQRGEKDELARLARRSLMVPRCREQGARGGRGVRAR